MPQITVNLGAGRTTEEYRELVARLTDAACETLGVPPERVSVFINELEPHQMARGGKLRLDQQPVS
jgi:4-oxalocrotonate tautomerase